MVLHVGEGTALSCVCPGLGWGAVWSSRLRSGGPHQRQNFIQVRLGHLPCPPGEPRSSHPDTGLPLAAAASVFLTHSRVGGINPETGVQGTAF